MKCFTVTENGVSPGIEVDGKEPYPHVIVGDPRFAANYRRVEVDEEIAGAALSDCSRALDQKDEGGRSSYKLVAANGKDDDRALVLFKADCAGKDGRTFYKFPRNTPTLASGHLTKAGGHRMSAPVELVEIKQGEPVGVLKTEDVWQQPELVFAVSFDGNELRKI